LIACDIDPISTAIAQKYWKVSFYLYVCCWILLTSEISIGDSGSSGGVVGVVVVVIRLYSWKKRKEKKRNELN
jgi:hypothetical protein